MDKIKDRIYLSEERGIMHDSRKDVRTLGKAINMLINKVNELIEENKELKQVIPKTDEPVKNIS